MGLLHRSASVGREIAITLIAMTIGAESRAEQEGLIRRKASV